MIRVHGMWRSSSFGYHSTYIKLTSRKNHMVYHSSQLTPRLKGNDLTLTFPDFFREAKFILCCSRCKSSQTPLWSRRSSPWPRSSWQSHPPAQLQHGARCGVRFFLGQDKIERPTIISICHLVKRATATKCFFDCYKPRGRIWSPTH